MENENSCLPFLDLLIHRQVDGNLKYSIYRKPTNSLAYLHYLSGHSKSTKTSVISSQFLRAYRVCEPEFLDDEIKFITDTFGGLGYPIQFIENAHRKARGRFYNESNRCLFNPEGDKIITVPYNISLETSKHRFKEAGFHLAFRYPSTTSNTLIRNSPKVDIECGVYEVPCNDCDSKYYGETGRELRTRISEHKRDVRNANENNAVFLHIRDKHHNMDWDSSKIIYKSTDFIKRRLIESALIKNKDNFNTSEGNFQLNNILNQSILRHLKLS